VLSRKNSLLESLSDVQVSDSKTVHQNIDKNSANSILATNSESDVYDPAGIADKESCFFATLLSGFSSNAL